MSDDSQSPVPTLNEEENDSELPEDSVVIQFKSLNPSAFIENPSLVYEPENNLFNRETVDEKLGDQIINLIDTYKEIATNSFELSKQIIKHRLNNKNFAIGDIFYVFEKFFIDYPDPFPAPATFLTIENLKLFHDKLALHESCENQLQLIGTLINKLSENYNIQSLTNHPLEKKTHHYDSDESSDEDITDSEYENVPELNIKSQKPKKKKNNKKKQHLKPQPSSKKN